MHTQESLDDLQLKADVVKIAESLDLDTSGTRDTVTERILAFQFSSTEEEDLGTPDEGAETPSAPEAVQEEEEDAAVSVKLSEPAKQMVINLVDSFLGRGSKKGDTAVKAIEEGKQAFIKKSDGNVRFNLKVVPAPFVVADVSKDAHTNVACHLNRRLATKNLIPRG